MNYEKQIDRIVQVLRSGESRVEEFRIGVEFEHIVVDKESFRTINYYEENGIEEILKRLVSKGYKPKYEGNHVIGLEKEWGVITLEPGGQLELSIVPYLSIKEVERVYIKFLEDIIPILNEQNQLLMAIGYHPKSSIEEIPFNPKERYKYMSEYFKTTGKYAHNMMKGTAAIQVVIDYHNEEDFIKKFKVANFLSPVLSLISDNSPIFEGRVYDTNCIRTDIWLNTDSQRSGIVPGVFSKVFGYRDYAEYILRVPPIVIIEDGVFKSTASKTTEELLNPYTMTDEEVDHLLSMVFPDVRVRRYIEIRMGDSLPYPLNLSYVALIKGIFYNELAINYLYQMADRYEDEKVADTKKSMMEKGFEARIGCKKMKDLISIVFDLAHQGLEEEEKEYLIPLEKLANEYKSPAILSKERINKEGLEGLKWCALNNYLRGEA